MPCRVVSETPFKLLEKSLSKILNPRHPNGSVSLALGFHRSHKSIKFKNIWSSILFLARRNPQVAHSSTLLLFFSFMVVTLRHSDVEPAEYCWSTSLGMEGSLIDIDYKHHDLRCCHVNRVLYRLIFLDDGSRLSPARVVQHSSRTHPPRRARRSLSFTPMSNRKLRGAAG